MDTLVGRNRKRQYGDDVFKEVFGRGLTGQTPREIQTYLKTMPEFKGRVPSERTIRRWLKSHVRRSGDRWSFADAENPSDGRLVLDVLGHVIDASNGRIEYLTKDEAHWIIRVRRAYPEMSLENTWTIANWYLRSRSHPERLHQVDQWLARGAWNESEFFIDGKPATIVHTSTPGWGPVFVTLGEDEEESDDA
jgi:hypothetical protein